MADGGKDKPVFKFSFGEAMKEAQSGSAEKPNFFSGASGGGNKIAFSFPQFAVQGEKKESKDDDDNGEIEEAPRMKYKPIVNLELVEVKDDSDLAEEIYSQRCKVFRFDSEIKAWKERGVGLIKILKEPDSKRFRLLMRQEKTYKIRVNHYITPPLEFKPMIGTEKAWMWSANDYSDEELQLTTFSAKFPTVEQANKFKEEVGKIVKEQEAKKFKQGTEQDTQKEEAKE